MALVLRKPVGLGTRGLIRTLWVGAPPTHDWGKKMPLVQKPGVDWGQHPEDAIPAK